MISTACSHPFRVMGRSSEEKLFDGSIAPSTMPEEKSQTLQAGTDIRNTFSHDHKPWCFKMVDGIISKGFTKKFKRITACEKHHFVPTSKQTTGKRQRSCGVASALSCTPLDFPRRRPPINRE
jgi:hypothetical protein